MPSAYQLSQYEKIASAIYILASITLIESSNKAQEEEAKKHSNIQIPSTPNSSQLAAAASKQLLIANIVFLQIASTRLNQVKQDIKSGDNNQSIKPNIYITSGWILSTLGSVLKVIGTDMRTQESPVTIV